MSKRRADESDSDIDVSSTDSENEEQEIDEEIVNVDFDYFDINPEVDFHATKNFLRQLFGDDCNQFDMSSLADLILKNNEVGSTIKTDGKESDPFAILSIINVNENKSLQSVKAVLDYILKKTGGKTELNLMLRQLLQNDKFKVGLIISERLINMPVELMPPMYKMFLEELEKSQQAEKSKPFDYFVIVSKVYELVAANVEDDEDAKKTKKKKIEKKQVEMDYFHYEDIVLEQNCVHHANFSYDNKLQETDARRVFTDYGIDPKLSVILIDRKSLEKSVPEMEEKFPPF